MEEENKTNEPIDDILDGIQKNNDDFIKDIKKYWSIVSPSGGFDYMIEEPIKKLKKKMPKVPMHEWDKLVEEFNIPALKGEYINHLMQHFTHSEIKEVIKLYDENPLLRQIKFKNAVIIEETYKMNEKWTLKFSALMTQYIKRWNEEELL